MKPADNIEKLIKNVPVNTSAERDEEVLEDVLNALEKSNNLQSVVYLPNLWRITMKSKITKLGTAAVVVLVVIIGVAVWLSFWPKFERIGRLENQLAQVQAELAKAKKNAAELNDWRNKMKKKEAR